MITRKKRFISYKKAIFIGLLGGIISLVILPFPCIIFSEKAGFIITTIIILCIGLIKALLANGFFGLISMFPIECIVSFSTGQGISGILMNVIQYIVLFATSGTSSKDKSEEQIEKEKKLGAIIYFSISGIILLGCIVLLLIAFKTEFFKFYLELANAQKVGQIQRNSNLSESQLKASEEEENKEKNEELIKKEIKNEATFCNLFKLVYDMYLLCVYIYVVTFSLFPAVSITQKLFNIGIYNSVTIITIYNLCDTLGRLSISKIKPKKPLTYSIVLGRSIFLILIPLNYAFQQRLNINLTVTSILTIVFIGSLGITNGIGGTLIFGLTPTLVPNNLKGAAGSNIGFYNITGIFTGSLLQFLFKFIIDKIKTG